MMTRRRAGFAVLAILGSALVAGSGWAMSVADVNLVDLLRDSNAIVKGQVTSVTDGIDDRGLPYTEVTMEVAETIRGDISGTYTFRQFGLKEPRVTADGTKQMMPAPEGFPRWVEGESVVLFLYPQAAWTGFRTTTGLGQGKFVLGPARVENEAANQGLFGNISLAPGLATGNDDRMLATEIGAVNPDTFLPFVRRAVQNAWVENCKMWNTDQGPTCGTQGRRPTRPTLRDTINAGPTRQGSSVFGSK